MRLEIILSASLGLAFSAFADGPQTILSCTPADSGVSGVQSVQIQKEVGGCAQGPGIVCHMMWVKYTAQVTYGDPTQPLTLAHSSFDVMPDTTPTQMSYLGQGFELDVTSPSPMTSMAEITLQTDSGPLVQELDCN